MTIDTREELINALREACEIEHGLMVQYLYTALTMRRSSNDGLSPAEQVLARQWQAAILSVAEDEMYHLAMVCQLLSAIGGVPKFHRPNMPKETGYYPFKFDLVPFSDTALYRFMVFELPRGMDLPPPPDDTPSGRVPFVAEPAEAPVPDPLDWQYVGELYGKISNGLQTIPEDVLFLRPNASGIGEWGRLTDDNGDVDNAVPGAVTGLASAQRAIQWIIEEGEGTSNQSEGSHYHTFATMRQAYTDAGRFAVAKDVPVNPATREHRDAEGPIDLIENDASKKAVETFNAAYGVTLYLLQFQFALAPNTINGARPKQRWCEPRFGTPANTL